MTFDELVDKWQAPIGEWAIEKGWIARVEDPAKPQVLRIAPRDMLHLLMLMCTELAELEAGDTAGDEANIREEIADFAIRAIQMRAEYGFTCKTEGKLSVLWSTTGETEYKMVAEAAEAWRKKDLSDDEREVHVWGHLAIAIATLACDYAEVSVPPAEDSVSALWEERILDWLDAAIADKMEVNAKRPYKHGKLA